MKIPQRKHVNLLKFNLLDFDFLVDFLEHLRGCLFRKLRTIVINFNHNVCLWLLFFALFSEIQSKLCSIRTWNLACF